MIDKDKVIEGLIRHSGEGPGGCWDAVDGEIKRFCPYHDEREPGDRGPLCYQRLFADAIALIENNNSSEENTVVSF